MGIHANHRSGVAVVVLAALAMLLARASVLGAAFPFAPALLVAAAAAGFGRAARLVAAAAALTAAAAGGGWSRTVEVALAALAIEACLLGWRPATGVGWALLAGTCTATAGLSRLASTDVTEYRLVAWGFESLLAAAAAPAFADALQAGLPVRAPGRQSLRLAPIPQRALYAALLAGAALGGLGAWRIGALPVAPAIGAGAALLGAVAGGPAFGAAAGAAIGVALGLGEGISAAVLGRFSLAGLLGGAFAGLGRLPAAAAFAAGQIAAGYYAESADGLGGLFWQTAVAAGPVFLVPTPWLAAMRSAVEGTAAATDAESEERRILGQRLRDFGRVFGELAQAFEQAAPAAQPQSRMAEGETELAAIHATLRNRVCVGCPLHKTCWDDDFYHTYSSLKDLWTQVELQGAVQSTSIGGVLRKRCIRPGEIASTTNYLYDLFRVDRFWQRRVHESRDLVSAQLRGVASVVERLAREIEQAGTRASPPAPSPSARFEVHYGVARLAKSGGMVSGDTVSVRQLDPRRFMMVLSDGMGAGPKAALESRAAVALLERLLELGFAPPVAVQTVNSVLLARTAEEKFATVDLLLLDLVSGRAELIKIAASPTFLRRGDQVDVVRSSSLPVGILSQVEVESTSRGLEPGDWLVMATDGLFAGHPNGGGEGRVVELLRRAPAAHPQALAESLLAHMFGDRGGDVRDDATVLALRLALPAAATPGEAVGGGWAAAARRRG